MSKDCPRLSRLGVLAPAALSACMDASVLAVPAAGAIVSTVLKELSKAFMLKRWFHGIMSAKEAEHLMMEKGKNGSFLVRESLTHPGEYVLSVRVRGRVSHVMIRRQHDKYDVGSGEQFDDLVGLIEHFRSYPMIENSGDVLRLLQPVSGTCVRARDIDRRIEEMEHTRKATNWSAFDEEFHALRMMDSLNVAAHKEGLKPENLSKNRYKNILPFDQTRVVLRDYPTDYINANFIRYLVEEPKKGRERGNRYLQNCFPHFETNKASMVDKLYPSRRDKRPNGASLAPKSVTMEAMNEFKKMIKLDGINGNYHRSIIKDKVYIATQGPLPNTADDFWRMLWQEDVRVIAMITKDVEKERQKCEPYWPAFGQEKVYHKITVKFQLESGFEDYVVREFEVSDSTTSRMVYQYHYTEWEDHEIPLNPGGMVRYINDINRKMYHIQQEKDYPEQNILCVHCSAGIGRTGTFITIDMLIDKIKISGFNCDIDVHNTVKMVRGQRHGMVQNRMQYRFIYLALRSYIEGNTTKVRKMVYKLQA